LENLERPLRLLAKNPTELIDVRANEPKLPWPYKSRPQEKVMAGKQQAEREAFEFQEGMEAGARSARALEYQALYLSRIEGHLDRIATYMGHGPQASLMTEVQQIRVALGLAGKRG
jgi:hypothetical protein